jgi:hypothetical protein
LFADDARVSTAWGQVWQGKSQLPSFLHSFFYEDVDIVNIPTRPLQTLAQCEDRDTITWTFRYASGVNSAIVATVENNQVVKLYWGILPYDFDTSQSDSPGWLPGSEARAPAVVEASAIALAGSGLMYLVLLSDRPKRATHVSGEVLCALLARVQDARTQRSYHHCAGANDRLTSGALPAESKDLGDVNNQACNVADVRAVRP